MQPGIDERISEFLTTQKKHGCQKLFSTREIADAVGATIYQIRGYLDVLQSYGVVEKVNSGRGSAGQWRPL
ncbi:FaeA/PapI family transcriptional regulator [Escherichia coli]|uniref:FaeA/PapI family transcriptional regulator n=1 Tax=Escherichia coli TaxID=562 RepID=UPI000251168D|nr:FaeA/PapI family transcriptional regulator [Escherichia coli]EGE2290367.1 faeA-like family protein [Escherichia coli]EHW98235.1 faeA-like family protein [Escherichia coli DEC10F]EKI4284142.1 faeA-like family protein [Escherichia coli]HDR9918071.1 faeA-like family protein [Escherichia coli RDEC-1 (10f)]